MRKRIKLTIIILIAVIVIPLGWWAGFKVFGWFDYHVGLHITGPRRFAYYKCDPKKLLTDLEDVFDINFPDSITTVKTGDMFLGGANHFVMRFTAEPNVVGAFVSLLQDQDKIRLAEYVSSKDSRSETTSRIPGWFTKPIRQGKIGHTSYLFGGADRASRNLYVDMTHEDKHVVYWSGFYVPKE